MKIIKKKERAHPLHEMAEVGRYSDVIISVYDKEGSFPHFHYYIKQGNRKGCLRIDIAEFFPHSTSRDALNSKELKELSQWLTQPNKNFRVLTNFEVICGLWNSDNPTHEIPYTISMPNYEETVLPQKDRGRWKYSPIAF